MDTDVIIAGAGPVGLALALGLAKCGVRSILCEKQAELSPHSRAIVVWPRTAQIFESWGVIEAFLAHSLTFDRVAPIDVATNRPILRLDMSDLKRWTPLAGPLILPQDVTERLLFEAVQATGLCDLRFQCAVTGFVDDGDAVSVTIESGTGETSTLKARFLVGCDGAHSVIRGGLGWHLEGKTYPQQVALADIRLTGTRDQLPWPRIDLSSDGLLIAIRFREGRWRIIDGITPKEGETIEARTAQRVEALFGPGEYETEWLSDFHIHNRVSPGFRKGRVFLAGDAAHLNSPAGGQGMNGGLQDAHNLAWKIARVLAGTSDAHLLDSYEQERRHVIEHVLNPLTDRLTETILNPVSEGRRRLIELANPAFRIKFIRDRALKSLAMFDAPYPASSILPETPQAFTGTIMPDLSLEDSYLYESLYTGSVLLLFDRDEKDPWLSLRSKFDIEGVKILRVVRPHKRAYGDFVRATSDTQWWEFGTHDRRAMLIRPDGYIGWQQRAPKTSDILAGVARALALPNRRES